MQKTFTMKLNLEYEEDRRFYEALHNRDRLRFSSAAKYVLYCVLTHPNLQEGGECSAVSKKSIKENREFLKQIVKEALEEYDQDRTRL